MSTSFGRSVLVAAALAALLGGCAAPAPAAAPEPPATPATTPASPEPITAAAGDSRIPASCAELLGAAGDEMDLDSRAASDERYWGAWWLAHLQAGLTLCDFESAEGDRLVLLASVYADSDFTEPLDGAETREMGGILVSTSCPELEPGVPYYCTARMSTGPYFLETRMFRSAGDGDAGLTERHDRVVASVTEAVRSLGEPLASPSDQSSRWAWPTECEGFALASTPSGATFSSLAETPYPAFISPEDLGLALLYAEPEEEVLACDWSPVRGAEFSDVRVEILRGASWALERTSALPAGRPVDVAGADQARILEHPWLRAAVVAGAVGPDLVLAHVFESEAAPSLADREAAAIALLSDVISTAEEKS